MTLKIKLAAFSAICIILAVVFYPQKRQVQKISMEIENSNTGFAVMELFTSQGCSSCPPADDLLGKYAAKNNDHLIALAFHVDYWNRLGWTDSFSSARYSARQRDYAMTISNASVYTPQLVINGAREFVGSDAERLATEVTNSLKENAVLSITIDKMEVSGRKVSVNFNIDKTRPNTSLHAALIQKQVFTNILKGENRGLKLINYNVVRDFTTVSVNNQISAVSLQLPAGGDEKDFAIALYAQDDTSGKIIGATKKDL